MYEYKKLIKAFIISDTHFGHEFVMRKERYSKFDSIEEHDNFIIEAVNKIVSPDSLLFHLGDIGNLETAAKLNGRKILIKGNHDNDSNQKYLEVFDEVWSHPIFINKRILLSHIPQMVSPHVLNIHGHLHGSYLDSKNHMNASIHMINYNPIQIKEAISYIDKNLPREQIAFLAEWFAAEQVFTNKNRQDLVLDENGKIKLSETMIYRKENNINQRSMVFLDSRKGGETN